MKRLAVILALALSTCLWADSASSVPQPLAGRIIVIDPGHAVMDENGSIINAGAKARHGVFERDVVLAVAEKLVPLLEAQGARVYLTRTRDNPWRYTGQSRHSDNRARAIFANTMHADVYVRLHCDWNRNRKFKGYTTYYFRWGSRRLAKTLERAFVETLAGHKNNGTHRRPFVSVTSTMPSVLLELGVLSYKPEGKDLGSEGYQTRLAEAVSTGLVNYFTTVPVRHPGESRGPGLDSGFRRNDKSL